MSDTIGLSFKIYIGKRDPFFEAIVINANRYEYYFANKAVEYCRKVLNSPWPKAERVIIKDPVAAYKYARYILKRRWKKAEKIIANNGWASYLYSRFVIKGQFRIAEKHIAGWHNESYWYAKNVLKGRFETGEKSIVCSYRAAEYAANVLKKRWEVAEQMIIQSASLDSFNKYIEMLRGQERIDFHNKVLAVGIGDTSVAWRKPTAKVWLERYGNDFVRNKI